MTTAIEHCSRLLAVLRRPVLRLPVLKLSASKFAAVWLVCSVLGACTTIAPERAEVVSVALDEQLAPLEYYEWIRAAPEAALKVELYGLTINSLTTDPVVTAVRTSMILGASAFTTRESEQQASRLIDDVSGMQTTTDIGNAYKMFAGVLQTLSQERQDLRAARATVQRALVEIDGLKSRNKQLQQQIEELTSIEQQIIEREQLNSLEP
ncbi:MAG: hypothetical protein V4628_01340 [Pseudomonadota bacterium]